ncbi:MAG TPA: pirin family protein [Flavobacteriales bacterium]|nr:pirin family protein [Flavobacteriales bacterium]
MNDQLPRRNFVKRFSLALSSLFVARHVLAQDTTSLLTDENKMKPIKNTKPLGFQWETQDPFLFCVHHEDDFPKGNDKMGPDETYFKGRHMGDDFITKDGFRMYHGKIVPGFPGHPHRGFETVTVVRKGIVDHADSMGAAGRYGNGDVQWMTAGKGVQHSEMFPLIKKEEDNPMELFQIWLNLPKKNKMVEPHFKMLWREDIPNYAYTDKKSKKTSVEIIAGELENKKAQSPPPDSWAADPANEVAIWNVKMEAGATWRIAAASKGINRSLYFYEGDTLDISGQTVSGYHAIEVEPDMELEITAGSKAASILVLQGRPIGEQVMQYGPFVMNTKEEIKQAFEDYHATQFGGWPWPKYDQVHDRDKTRFAKHADGREELKG